MLNPETRPLPILAAGLLTVSLLCGPPPAQADTGFLGGDGNPAGLGAPRRPEQKSGTPSRAQRGSEGGYRQPVDWICGGGIPGAIRGSGPADGPPGILCDAISIELVNPEGLEIQIQKSSQTSEITGPGPVDYEYFLFNASFLPLTGIEVVDDHVDAPPFCPFTNLPPMSSAVCTATYTVTPGDIQAGGSPVAGSGLLQNNAVVFTAEGVTATAELSIPFVIPSEPLVLLPASPSLGTVLQGTQQEFVFTAQGGVPPRTYSGAGAPAGMSFVVGPSGLILTGAPQSTGEFIVTVNVTDAASPPNFISRDYSLTVLSSLSLSPTGQPLPDAVAGLTYEFGFTISGGTPPYGFSADGTPPGMVFVLEGDELFLSGTAAETGEFTIDLTASDSSAPPRLVSETYALRVVPELRLLPLEVALPEAEIGVAYEFAFTTEGGQPPVELSGEGAPPGMQFAIEGGQLILGGAAEELGEYPVTVSAQDSASPPQVVVREYVLSVVVMLEIGPSTLPRGTTGQDYLAVLSVRNGFPPYQIDIPDLPAGLIMNSNAITGRPSQTGTFPVTAFASDARGNSGVRDYVLEVGTNNDVSIGETLPDAYLDTAYGYQLEAAGAPTPVTWSGASGLPDGLDLIDTGLVSGRAQQTGAFTFDATATSADGQVRTGSFDIRVRPPGLITAEPRFPPGLVGAPYETPTAVRGGTPPYECAVIEGSPPPGLSVAGCNEGIGGTPVAAGSFPFSLGVLDAGSPELVAELAANIQISDSTPIQQGLPPDLGFRPPLRVPTPELSVQRPDGSFPDESLQQLAVDPWGNRYLAGFGFNGTNYDIRVLKFSADGVLLWDQKYDSGSHDYGYGITVAPDEQAVYASGYSLAGNRYEAVLIRYDLVGVQQWVARNDGNSQVVAFYALAADERGVYAVGERYNGNNFDALVVHYSNDGSLLWETVRPSQQTRTAYAIVQTNCNEAACLVVGGAEGETSRSGWIERLDAASGTASPLALVPTAPVLALQAFPGGMIAGGGTDNDDWFITRLGPGGQVEWSVTESSGHRLRGLALDREGYIYAAGSGNSGADAMLALISPSGDVIGIAGFDDGAMESFHAVEIGPEGLVTAAGQRNTVDGNRMLLINYNSGKARQ